MPDLQIRKNFLWFIVLLNLTVLPVLYWRGHPALLHGKPRPSEPGLPVYGQMPAFELTRENGQPLSNRQMTGSLWVTDFIFTRCPNQCPMMSSKFGTLQKTLPPGVRLASFSVDPEHDTPEILRSYAQTYGADASRWIFLTGGREAVRRIMNALHLGQEDDPGMHSLRFVLLDKELRVREYYDSEEAESLGKMRADIEQLRKHT